LISIIFSQEIFRQ